MKLNKNILFFIGFLSLSYFSIFLCDSALAAKPAKGDQTKKSSEQKNKTAETSACSAKILIDAASGAVIQEDNADEALPPASMVKLMTSYVIFKKLKAGEIQLDDNISVSAAASKIGGSQVYLRQGEVFTLQEMLEALLVQSANDAAVAMAEHIAGAPEGFVEMMNAEAEAIGMKNFEFHSPHGLPPAKDQQPDLVSARDFAILSRALITEFPEVLKFTGISESTFRDGTFQLRNHNHLVRTFNGCDGLKTGFYSKAGFSVSATAQRKGLRMIAIVMGCAQRKKRDAEAARLLSLGFSQYKTVKLIEKGTPAEGVVPIQNGTKAQIIPVAASDFSGAIRIGEEKKVERKSALCPELKAPVSANTPCGQIVFLNNGLEIGRVDAVVPTEIPLGNIGDKIWNRIFGNQ